MEFIHFDEDSRVTPAPPVAFDARPETPVLSPTLRTALAHAQFCCAHGVAASTQQAYQSDMQQFTHWCYGERLSALPAAPETIALYLSALALAGKRVSTLTRRLAAIKYAHTMAGMTTPTEAAIVQRVLAGIRRTYGTAPQGVDALSPTEISRMVAALPATPVGVRDRALLLLGYAGAFRRSELVALDVEDLAWRPEGLAVLLRRSKTDPFGQGRWVGIPWGGQPTTCPVCALQAWLAQSGIAAGAIFRGMNRHGQLISARLSGRAVATLIKRAAAQIGVGPERVSGHTLRVSHVTAAARAGVPERVIQQTTGHKSVEMVRRYCRQGTLFTENSAMALGL